MVFSPTSSNTWTLCTFLNTVGAICHNVMCLPSKNDPLQKRITLCIDATLGGSASKLSGKLINPLMQYTSSIISFEHKC